MMEEKLILITAGDGPEECTLFVGKVLPVFLKDVDAHGFQADILHREEGSLNGTLFSVTLRISGVQLGNFLNSWKGTLQWICQSPYRKFHKRKNWFIGMFEFDLSESFQWNEKDITFQATRSSGPGGQHVNKTESAIRATHKASGLSVLVQDQRSQFQNKKLALQRIREALELHYLEKLKKIEGHQWKQHHSLERGNPIRVFEGKKMREI